MIISLTGLPGSGKSTFAREVVKICFKNDIPCQYGMALTRRPLDVDVSSRFLNQTAERCFNYKLAQFRFANYDLMQVFDQIYFNEFVGYNQLCELAAAYISAQGESVKNEVLIFDECFTHRLIYGFRTYLQNVRGEKAIEHATDEDISLFCQIVELLPASDLEVFIDIEPEVAIERQIKRAFEKENDATEERRKVIVKRLREKLGDQNVLDFQYKLNQAAVETFQDMGKEVLRTDGTNKNLEELILTLYKQNQAIA